MTKPQSEGGMINKHFWCDENLLRKESGVYLISREAEDVLNHTEQAASHVFLFTLDELAEMIKEAFCSGEETTITAEEYLKSKGLA